MADRIVSWDWGPWDDAPPPSHTEEVQETTNPTLVDPRSIPLEVVEIDKRISELEEELSQLKIRRLEAFATRALITRIPPEILSRVFELVVHETLQALPTISLVSQYWRNLALETPTLWSYIKLDSDWNYPGAPGSEFTRKIKTFTTRSQACKILVDLDFRYCDSLGEARNILRELQPHLSRCFSFRVSVPDWEWMAAVKEACTEMRENLEEVSLRIDPADSEDLAPVTLLSGVYPRLKSIILEQTPLACVHAELPAVRRFYLVRDQRYHSGGRIRVSLKEFLTALTSAEMLEDVRVQSAAFYLDGTEPIFQRMPTLVAINRLTDLSISHVDSANVGNFLESISLPSVVRLAVQMDSNSDDNMQWLTRISRNCSTRMPSLRHLELRACSVNGAALVPFVSALHDLAQLTALALISPPSGQIGPRLFNLMAGGPTLTGGWILPNLQALCVQNCGDISGHELLRVVRARRGTSVPDVKDVRVLRVVPNTIEDDIIDVLRQNVDSLQTN
ncbi:hypothetical protein BD410DRAFT_728147 [Rickenella mellea]|uniref:F-box domain-containing protein n=1 Tax=Rickenella mellea TaxID=50990 RepID=A0A4Y7PUS5_9AGAM|nr:hypothetical protein BD410DRAFT_728147 [Rickenella mellea]